MSGGGKIQRGLSTGRQLLGPRSTCISNSLTIDIHGKYGVNDLLPNLYLIKLSVYLPALAWLYDQEIGSSRT